MAETLEPLILDLVAWCAARPRTYSEVTEAWRTSCPRLMVWEEAHARGLLETQPEADGLMVRVTRKGETLAAAGSDPAPRQARAPVAAAPLLS